MLSYLWDSRKTHVSYVFQAHGHPPLDITWATFQCLRLGQNGQVLASSLPSSYLWRERLILSHRIWCSLYYIICTISTLLWGKVKEKQLFSSSLFFCSIFLREKKHTSYCCSGCGGLNMYNTSRHDHFLWLKPLKLASYFLKPIDLLTKSVCICPEITCSLTPRHPSRHKLASS